MAGAVIFLAAVTLPSTLPAVVAAGVIGHFATSQTQDAVNNNPRVDYNSESATRNSYNNGYLGQ